MKKRKKRNNKIKNKLTKLKKKRYCKELMVCPSFPEVFHEKLDFTTHPRKKEKKSKRYAPTNTLRHKVNTKKKHSVQLI